MPVWVSVPLSKATEDAMKNRANILKAAKISSEVLTSDEILDPLVKIHVDYLDEATHEEYRSYMMSTFGRPGEYFFDLGSPNWLDFDCHHRHDESVCKCKLPIYHIGQDEAVFKQFAMPSKTWSVKGKTKLRPKTEGMGIMVSAVFDEWRGFGLPLTESEILLVNTTREARCIADGTTPRPKIQSGESPGLIFFQYGNGKGKQGYWDGVKFQEQCIDFMDVLEAIYPDMQILLEVDHSSGHLKEQSDGLMVNAMGVKWGGKTVPKRDSVMEEGCLGPNPPVINGKQLTLGSIQKMTFEEGDDGPFYEPKAPRHDVPMSAEEIAKEKEKRKKKKSSTVDLEVDGDEDGGHDAPYVIPGFERKNKGIKQVSKRSIILKIRMMVSYICSNYPDFVRERSLRRGNARKTSSFTEGEVHSSWYDQKNITGSFGCPCRPQLMSRFPVRADCSAKCHRTARPYSTSFCSMHSRNCRRRD